MQFLKGQFRQWMEESTEPHFQSFGKEWEQWLEVGEGNKEQPQVVVPITEPQMNLFL